MGFRVPYTYVSLTGTNTATAILGAEVANMVLLGGNLPAADLLDWHTPGTNATNLAKCVSVNVPRPTSFFFFFLFFIFLFFY